MSENQKKSFEQRLAEGRGALLRQARENADLTQAELAVKAGTSQQTVDRIEKGQIRTSKLYPKLAQIVGINEEGYDPERVEKELRSLQDDIVSITKQKFRSQGKTFIPDDEANLLLKIFRSDADATMRLANSIVRAYPVANVPDAYAMIVQDSMLAPALVPGDVAVVNPNIPPYEGCDAVLVRVEDDVRKGVMRQIVSIYDDHWLVTTSSPTETEIVLRDEWPDAHVVVAKFYRVR